MNQNESDPAPGSIQMNICRSDTRASPPRKLAPDASPIPSNIPSPHADMDQRTPQELYTPGYTAAASDFMALRSAASHASFVLKYLRPTTRLLDGGCGPGSISCDLAASIPAPPTSGGQTSGGGQITGIDREPSQIDQARQRAADRKLTNISFHTASIYALPFPDASFDIVFAHALFEHLSDPAAALHEMHRVLVPGGLAAVRSPDWGGFLVVPELPGVLDALNAYAQRQTDNGGGLSTDGLLRRVRLLKAAPGDRRLPGLDTARFAQRRPAALGPTPLRHVRPILVPHRGREIHQSIAPTDHPSLGLTQTPSHLKNPPPTHAAPGTRAAWVHSAEPPATPHRRLPIHPLDPSTRRSTAPPDPSPAACSPTK